MSTPIRQGGITAGHSALFTVAGIVTVAGSMVLGTGTPAFHLALLVLLLPISGIPHGALDYYVGWKVLQRRLGRLWAFWFVAVYLIIMCIVIVAWVVEPVMSLTAFLLLTVYHFGTGDAIPTRNTPFLFRITEIIARGGMVITFPALVAHTEVIDLFSYLIPNSGTVLLVSKLADLAPLAAACALLTIGWGIIEFVRFRAPVAIGRVVELMATALVFLTLSPLLAFALYFSVLHSLRHMLAVAKNRSKVSLIAQLIDAYRIALPVTAVTIAMGAFVYVLLGGLSFEMAHMMKVVFIGIASMTYPHVVLVESAKRLGVIHSPVKKARVGLAMQFAGIRKGAHE